MKIAYFTICSRNYLAYALTLRESFLKAQPASAFFIYLADEKSGIENTPDGAAIIAADEIHMPSIWDMALRYSIMEFNTAIKPFCILDLWDKRGFDAAVYIDPDIYVLQRLETVEAKLAAGHDCVLTPHLCAPLEDEFHPGDIQIMRTGIYNLGFGAFANTPGGRRFVEWWGRRCETECVVDLENGLFVDQKFADYAPAFCDNAFILRDPGYNIAYWNIKNRPVTYVDGVWRANGSPITFFHFSGVVPGDPSIFSKHQNRFSVDDIGPAKDLLAEYLQKLDEKDHTGWKQIPYAFGAFSDGATITHAMRQVFVKSKSAAPADRGSALRPRYELFNAISPHSPKGSEFRLTRLMYEIWDSRKDLQDAFPLSTVDGRRGFFGWFLSAGEREHGVPDICLEPARRALANARHVQPVETPPGVIDRLGGKGRRLIKAAYEMSPAIRTMYSKIPVDVRMKVRRQILRADAELDALNAMETPTISPATGEVDQSLPPGVSIYGYFRTESGVGEGARRAFKALSDIGVSPASVTVGTQGVFEDKIDWPADDAANAMRRVSLLHVNADQTPLLGMLVDPLPINRSYRIGYWAWELAQFPENWTAAFDLVDEVWAPSEFVAASLRSRTNKPVHVIPHPIPSDNDVQSSKSEFGFDEDRVYFYANLDLNSFPTRKNPLAVIAAFKAAFANDEDRARLILKMHGGGHLTSEKQALLRDLRGTPNVIVVDEVLHPETHRRMQAACDVYVSLHRAEGFGLGISEFMALGKPVIVTGYSGNMDFTDDTCARIVDYDLVEVRTGEYPYSEGQFWADPNIDAAAAHMRSLARDTDARINLGQAARRRVVEKLSPKAVGELMRRRLHEIDPEI